MGRKKTPEGLERHKDVVSYRCTKCDFRCLCRTNHGDITCPACDAEMTQRWEKLEIVGVPEDWYFS